MVLYKDCVMCPLCKSKSNRRGYSAYGSQVYVCGNKQCEHHFVPTERLPGARHDLHEIIEVIKCVYKEKMSPRKASDYLKTKDISISHNGIRGWTRVVPDLIRSLVNSLKPESDDDREIDAIRFIKKGMSWLKPWRKYEYAKVSTYTPMILLKREEIKSNVIESREDGNSLILNINTPCTIKIDKEDKLTSRVMMASLNDTFSVTEDIVTANTKKYLEGGSSNLVDKRGGSESKLTPMVMEKIIYHLLDSTSNLKKSIIQLLLKELARNLRVKI